MLANFLQELGTEDTQDPRHPGDLLPLKKSAKGAAHARSTGAIYQFVFFLFSIDFNLKSWSTTYLPRIAVLLRKSQ